MQESSLVFSDSLLKTCCVVFTFLSLLFSSHLMYTSKYGWCLGSNINFSIHSYLSIHTTISKYLLILLLVFQSVNIFICWSFPLIFHTFPRYSLYIKFSIWCPGIKWILKLLKVALFQKYVTVIITYEIAA